MKIINPSCELWQQTDPIAHVARCARVCYGNAVSKGEEADKRLCESLKKLGHLSMFRHESVYAIIPRYNADVRNKLADTIPSPYIEFWLNKGDAYIATNGNFMIDDCHSGTDLYMLIKKHRVSPEVFSQTETGHKLMRYTFHITTQISTSRELNRVSPNNIAERSTRYVNESDGVICRPHWINEDDADIWNKGGMKNTNAFEYLCHADAAFHCYSDLINKGMKREDARGILSLDTATEVVYTYSISEWKRIIALRSDKRAHKNAQIITNMIKEQLEQLGYNF